MEAMGPGDKENVQPLLSDQQEVIHLPPTEQQRQQQERQNQQLQQQELEQRQQIGQDCGERDTPSDKPIDVDIDEDEEEDEDDGYDNDDDEEKDNSQKLVIDLHEDYKDEEEEDDVGDKDIIEQNEVVALELTKSALQREQEKNAIVEGLVDEPAVLQRTEEAENIITLSDAEEETATVDAVTKPGKIQKRKSVGAPATVNEEERYRLKRRKINVEGAPKMPLTGYVRYMNDRRESARKEYPNKTNIEITKQIGEEWQSLPSDLKAEYLKAAEEDKKRYTSELHTFLKSRPDVLASELAKNKIRKTDHNSTSNPLNTKPTSKDRLQIVENPKLTKEPNKDKTAGKEIHPTPSTSQNADKLQNYDKTKRKRTPTPPLTGASSSASAVAPAAGPTTSGTVLASAINIVTPAPGEIPIFTNEFLEHNKLYDSELRSLRKSKADLEQQNFVLEKHVENMKCGVEKMLSENNELQEKNKLLEIYLDKLKRKLALALSSLPLPNAPNGATVENIDKYMQDLYKMSTSNLHGPAALNKAKDIIRKLDLQIQL